MKNVRNAQKMSYDPEADVLAWEVSKQPIDYAEEIGNIVIHFNKKNRPVLIEILEASKFLEVVEDIVEKAPAYTRS